MATTDENVYLLFCTFCDAKLTSCGSVTGGNESCTHQYQAIANTSQHCQRTHTIDTNTRLWIRKLIQNKKENQVHCVKFREDLNELNQYKSSAINHISAIIKRMKAKLDEREQELTQQLSEAFEERRHRIWDNMKILAQHKIENEETTYDMLRGIKQVTDAEKVVVERCQNIINATPNVKYVGTELRYTFDSIQQLQQCISEFGALCSKPLDSGKTCTFQSVAGEMKAKILKILAARLRSSSCEGNRNRIRIAFKMGACVDDDIDIMQFLKIHLLCAEYNDDGDEKDEMFAEPIYEEYMPLHDCERERSVYIFFLSINKRLAGRDVALKIRVLFESPDESIYEHVNGKWSRIQIINVPEMQSPKHISMIVVYLGTKKRVVLKNNYRRGIYEYTMDCLRQKLIRKFESKFERKYGYFDSRRDDGELLQMDEDIVNSWFSSGRRTCTEYEIVPYSEALLFGFIRNIECKNVGSEIVRMIFQWFSGSAEFRSKGRHWNCWKETNEVHGNEEDETLNRDISQTEDVDSNSSSSHSTASTKRCCLLVRFNDIKKRVVLKNIPQRHIYEFTMDALVQKLMQRLKRRGLEVPFTLKTDEGHVIASDDDVIRYLIGYNGELEIIQ